MKNDIKIFQIGFNKCGTSSLYELFYNFCKKEFDCVHWDYGKIAYHIEKNIEKETPLLSEYKNINFYSDMECIIEKKNKLKTIYGFKYFNILDQQYPNSKFVLNTRNIDNWIKSRLNHYVEYILLEDAKIKELEYKKLYSDVMMEIYELRSINQLINLWKNQWNIHHSNVLRYFHNRPDDLLVFDIEKDSFKKISNFFAKCDIEFTKTRLPHENKTKA